MYFNKTIMAVAISTVLIACSNNQTGNSSAENSSAAESLIAKGQPRISETARLNQWFADRYEEELSRSPISTTFLGRKDNYSKIDDMSEAAEALELEWKRLSVENMLSSFDYDALDDEGKMSYDIWKYQYEVSAAGAKFSRHGYIFEQMGGSQSELPNFLINFHRVDNADDMQAYIDRIGAIANGIDQLLTRVKVAAADGIRPPKFAYVGALDQSMKLLNGAPFKTGDKDSALWGDAKVEIAALLKSGKIDKDKAATLEQLAKAALLNEFLPSYTALNKWLTVDMVNADANSKGASALPNGLAYYNHRLAASTTTNLTADEVHNIGLNEVARLRESIVAIKKSVGFKGDLQEFFAYIRKDQQFYFADTDAGRQGYIDGAQGFLDDISAKLPSYFGLLPKAELVVKRVEAFREQDGAAQHYYPGTPDGSRPGVYYAHLSDMTAMPRNQMEVISYHEGLPGHHMQLSIAQELEGVPQFRAQASFTAYVEGWALYAEYLAVEMGSYADPYSEVGRLSSEIWRAIRLVVDTGMHAKGWSEEKAVQYFMANSPEPEESVRIEVQRYLVWPGQATSYKIGMLKIIELRREAEKQLGDRFDIRRFHDVVLGGGALPLSILELKVADWIAATLAG